MQNMKILIARCNYSRYPKFRVGTIIYQENNKKLVRKQAFENDATDHLQNIYKAYNLLKNSSIDIYLPNLIRKDKYYLDFEYFPYPSLEKLIEESIIKQTFSNVEKYVRNYLKFIDKFEIEIKNPYSEKKFEQIFDKEKRYYSKNKEEVIKLGVLDLNFDNVLLNEENFYFIDFEWVFDFPIPKNYIVFRAIFYLSSKLQSLIKTFCSPKFPCLEILENFLIPLTLWNKLNFSSKEIERFLYYEINFQNIVNITKEKFNKRIIKEKHILYKKQIQNKHNPENLISILQQKNKEIEELKTKLKKLKKKRKRKS